MNENALDRRYLFVFTIVFSVAFLFLFRPFDGLGSDTVMYYSYLSSPLFDGDLDPTNDFYLSHNAYGGVDIQLRIIGPKGMIKNFFAVGSAILWAPFYLPVRMVGWGWNAVSDAPPAWVNDRFSAPYLFAISFATLCYGFLTLILMYHTCRFHFDPHTSFLATLGAVFATPLSTYIFTFPAMSHALSAFSVALLFYLSFRHREFAGFRSYVILAAVLGLSTLVRWQNALFGLIPFAFWLEHLRKRAGRTGIEKTVAFVGASALLLVAIVSLQSCCWWWLDGSFLTMPQGSGFMNWGSPAIADVLFSGWHGLYYTHPLLLLATIGLPIHLIRNGRCFPPYALLICVGLMIYVNASAGDWSAGSSVGARRFCASIPLFAFGLAAVFSVFRGRLRAVPAALAILSVGLGLFYQEAFIRGIFDTYFLHELWRLRGDVVRALPLLVLTFPLNGYAFAAPIVAGRVFSGLAVALVGLFLIWGLWGLLRKEMFAVVEKRAVGIAIVFAAAILALDVAILLTTPGVDEEGLKFNRLMSVATLTDDDRAQLTRELFESGCPNPAFYFYAYERAQDPKVKSACLQAVYEIDPTLWARWIATLPARDVEERKKATAIYRKPAYSADEMFARRVEDAWVDEDERESRRWLKRYLRYQPFQWLPLQRLTMIYQNEGRYKRAGVYRERLLRYLLARRETYIAVAKRRGDPHRGLFKGYYKHHTVLLGLFYHDLGRFEQALEIFSELLEVSPADAFIQNMKRDLEDRLKEGRPAQSPSP